jgi:uncharacterized repeat protein (TIGR02543 family)
MRKIFLLLAVTILLAVSSFAQTSGTCGSNLTWTLDNGTLTINGTGAMTNYSSNGAPWYSNRSSITAVVIPEGLTSLGQYAFYGCTNLKTVNYNATNCTSFGSSYADYCAFYNLSSITTLNIGENVTKIPIYAFYACSGITSINVPNSVTSLGDYAFYACSGATALTIGSGVTAIPYRAFYGCSNIPSVTINEGVTSIGYQAFIGCSRLATVNFNATSCNFASTSYADYNPFYNLPSITTLNIGENVTKIPAYAFYSCTGITSINIPNSVTSLGDYAFCGCSGATALTIGTGVTAIPYRAFYSCSNIPSVTINEGVTSIGYQAFIGCSRLATVNFNATNCNFYSTSDYDYNPFYNLSSITTLNIGENVTKIPKYAFYGCSGITSINIPNSVTSLGDYAFYACSGATALTIGTGVTAIPYMAFYGCSNIPSVTINEGVTSISYRAFYGCSRLATVNFNATSCNFYSTSNYDYNPFYNLSSITTLNIGANVTKIPVYAFYGCSGITSINIPNSVTSLGDYAFYGCSGATALTIGTGVTAIPYMAFYSCSNIPSVTINEGVTSISYRAFSGCSRLAAVNFNATNCNFYSTSNYDSNPFYNLSSIATLNIGANVTKIPVYAFYGCSGITSINIPNSVTSIGDYAFYNCSGATSLTIGTGVTSIPYMAFYSCSKIPSITIPSSVTSIGYGAFRYCSLATSATIPSSVTTISDYAFANCTGLTSVRNLHTTPQTISSYTFGGVTMGNVNLLVPQASILAYRAANYWENFNISSATFNVTFFKRNDESNTPQTIVAYSLLTEPATPTHPDEHYFYGWYTDSISWDADTKWDFNINTVNGNTDLYARWIPQNMIKVVTFNSMNDTEVVKDTVPSGETGASFIPVKTGYIFAGWYDDTNLFDFNTPITADITLAAHWTPQNYDISYNLNGGENDTNNPASYTIESASITLQNPTRTGCTFADWEEGSTIPAGSTGNKTFTAQWNLISYNIAYNLNDGTNHPSNPSSYTVESDITLQDPTKASHGFTGWEEGNAIPLGSTGDKTFTAQWVLNSVSAVTTIPVSNITDVSAVLGGEIQGTGSVICGVIYSSSQSLPTLTTENTTKKTNASPAMRKFTLSATDLIANTSYYMRAWAINEQDTVYGEVKFFTTRSSSSCYRIEKLNFTQSLPSLVDILVRVRDCNGKGANYLENSDFQVWENDELTNSSETHSSIRKMDAMPFVIKTTLVLDATSSLNIGGENGIEAVKSAAIKLVQQKDENQEFSVIIFNRTIPEQIQNFTANKDTLISAINSIDSDSPGNTTRLYDAYTTGLNNLPTDSVEANFIRKSFMVVFTDGNDASVGQPNAQQRLNDAIAVRQKGGQQVYTIGLGNVDANILSQLASTPNDYKPIDNLSQLESMFVEVQSEIMREANSFYLLNYLSPKRGGTHDLKLKIAGNTNSSSNAYAQQTFDAADFVSAQYGVYVNPYTDINGVATGMYGIDNNTIHTLNNNDELTSATYWSDVVPQYEWSSSNPDIVATEIVDYNKVKLNLTDSGTAVITVKDVSNYNYVNSGSNTTIAPYNASAFQRSFTVNSTGTTATITFNHDAVHTVNFDTDGGIPVPETQHVSDSSKVQEPSIVPVKAGFEFLGWYNNGLMQYDFDNAVTSNLDLSARWISVSQIESTLVASSIKKDSVTISGTMEYGGQIIYTERGICYATTLDPTVTNTKQIISGTDNEFSIRFGALSANTSYFVRPYAVNAQDTVYGKYIAFTTRQATERYRLTGYPPVATKKPSFVEVLVSVKDNLGKGTDYLEDKDFILKQNDQQTSEADEFHRYINKMDAIPFKIQTVLMLDNSSSMGYAGFEQLKQAAVELVKSKHEKQYYAVYSFSDDATLVQDFSNNVDTLVQQISKLKLGTSTTDLYDSYITGINHLPAEYSNKDSIQKCFFVMLSDGDETQQQYSATLAQTAINARGSKTAYMIGLGQDLNTARLTALASSSANYYSATSITQVKGIFANIQNDIMREANSFYNLVYLTDMRDLDETVKLELTINNNQNTAADRSYTTTFTSTGTADDDVSSGVYLNVYENIPNISIGTTNKYGIGMPDDANSEIRRDTMGTFVLQDEFVLKAVTYWADVKPQYVWASSNPDVATLESIDFDKAIVRFSGNSADTVIISVKDVANYDLVASGNGQGIPASSKDFFIRSISVKGIIKQEQTITWDQTFQDVTYGDVIILNATASSNLPVSYSLSNESIGIINDNTLTINGIGSVAITVNQSGNIYYHSATVEKLLNVNKAVLNVVANDTTKIYSETNPDLTYSISGFKNDETQSVIDVLPTVSTTAIQTSNVGTYPVVVSDASDDNYDFSYTDGSLEITKAALTVMANDATREYGEINPDLTYSVSGFKNDETQIVIDVLPTVSTTAIQTSDVGTYPVVVSDASDDNYDFSYTDGSLEITKAALTVAANDATREYGEINPDLTYSISGFKNDETQNVIDVLPAVSTTAIQTSDVETYPVMVSDASDDNYDFSYTNGSLEITKAALTVTAENKTREQGQPNPIFTLAYGNFKNDEDAQVLDELPVVSCTADEASPVGFYDIVLSGGSDNNYEYTLVNGHLEVTSPTGIAEAKQIAVRIYPNPVKDELYIRWEGNINKVELYSLSGNLMISESHFNEILNVSALLSGVYLLKIHTDNGLSVSKIVKK